MTTPVETFAPGEFVASAARVNLPFGMFSYLAPRPEGETDPHWQMGARWEYINPGDLQELGPIDDSGEPVGLPLWLEHDRLPTGDSGDDSGEPLDPGWTAAGAFEVVAHFVASPIAWPPALAKERAQAKLLTSEERQVEHAFWFGEQQNYPTLAGGVFSPPAAAPVSVGSFSVAAGGLVVALGELEQFIGSTYSALGVVHMARSYATQLLAARALVVQGSRLLTRLGTPVIAGSGYPEGHMYGTPAIFGYRSDIWTSSNRDGDLLNKLQNDMHAIAARNYLLGFDPTGVGVATITA